MHRIAIAAVLASSAAGALVAGPAPSLATPAAAAACPTERGPAGAEDTVYLETQVDRQAKPRRGNPEVPWPSGTDPRAGARYESRIRELTQGEVELRFVVDAQGCADMRTVQVVQSSDTAFTLAVVDVLPRYRFEPAVKGRKAVAQLLHWKWALYRRNGARLP
jgi:outer membrane biosynthesis protein TonB